MTTHSFKLHTAQSCSFKVAQLTCFMFFQSLNDFKMMERFFVLLLLFSSVSIFTSESVTVRTMYGDIRGTVMAAPPIPGSAVTKVNAFLGIPFAAPPVGELRFQPPKPAQAWKPKAYNATQFGKACIQDPYWLNRFVRPGMKNFT